MGGRYLDRFERRGPEWRILERQVVLDCSDNWPAQEIVAESPFASTCLRGQWGREDPFYDVFANA